MTTKRFLFLILAVSLLSISVRAVEMYPPNWWTGMKYNQIQLMFYAPENADFSKENIVINYPGIDVLKKNTFENGKYIILDLKINETARPGMVNINFLNSKQKPLQWELKERRKGNGTQFAKGVVSSDFIYLLMPDRFSNGDYSNDRVPGMKDQSLNRDSIYDRHGGDLQGVINHLDYLQSLGITALWMTPVIENDMPNRTEHGYAFTNHYRIDPRLGGEKAYLALSDSLHARGMKLIQDAVYNHVGLYHFLVQDGPDKDWLHQFPEYTQTNYRDQLYFDPYVAPSQKRILTDGWFTKEMPDLNHENPFVANFLIQHAIWCVEKFGLDGWRIDTYIYNNLEFMNRCNQALTDEYPNITMFGETWVHGTANQAYFAQNVFDTPFKSNLQGVTDFQTLLYGILPALNEKQGWTEGVYRLYTTLSNDFLYKNPMRNVIMLDNHDLSRIFSTVGEDVDKVKIALGWLMTCRGIPQMYYGTEILMAGVTYPHDGFVRKDFPGGWEGDKKNAFTGEGLSDKEKEMQEYVRTLGNFRLHSSALKTGKMMQYVPKDGLYAYFRYDENQTIACIMNPESENKPLSFGNYPEMKKDFVSVRNIITGEVIPLEKLNNIPPKTMYIFELTK
ncbi:MAG: glycoside hydrolase family 13 protein [Candidatus Azobacteroides sp.]|nr:glycoside hydrolase family 13 protein [Candidatus Azobacteroides sp.]